MNHRNSRIVSGLLVGTVASLMLPMTSLDADKHIELLDEIAERYESMVSYEFDGHQVLSLPNTNCAMDFHFQVASGARPSGSDDKALFPFSPTIQFHGSKISKSCLAAVEKLGFVTSPGWWIDFDAMDIGVTDVRKLPQQEVVFPNGIVRCVVLEVQYDEYTQRVKHFVGPIRYWMESATKIVRRIEFNEATALGARPWVATVETIKIGGGSPSWLHEGSDLYLHSALVGKLARDFELRNSDGQMVKLRDLRGNVVLLDFWTTWCLACELEIPILEKLQAEMGPSAIILGVTDEDATTVEGWRNTFHRSFRTLVNGRTAFDDFNIKPIPVIVVIDRSGLVRYFIEGARSENRIRRSLKDALAGGGG